MATMERKQGLIARSIRYGVTAAFGIAGLALLIAGTLACGNSASMAGSSYPDCSRRWLLTAPVPAARARIAEWPTQRSSHHVDRRRRPCARHCRKSWSACDGIG